MPAEEFWIAERMAAARRAHPSVTQDVAIRVSELLQTEFSAGPLSRSELLATADALLAAIEALPANVDPAP